MGSLKYSRQRASIKEYLMSTVDHPTADTVYLHVRKEFPRISLGTVYRNLNLLADMGEAVKITTPNSGDRFDGRTDPHYHVVCTSCGNVFDVDVSYDKNMFSKAVCMEDGFIITSHELIFEGICRDCREKEKENGTERIKN